ncbi:uncharacterized protein LOC125833376 [Solanum verrucosum]|uniref:uncharacterized protein LOC125833376 n=1 Tax=Solanum verrucosum TaxID=315347 RepID=UPI0020D0060F|nr:uncharacterized protein LOC125833376 [Solanum verrucosum]
MSKIDKTNSPVPDGYGSAFSKVTWRIVDRDMTEIVLEFFQNERLLRQVNITNIALIQKMEVPEHASQFRPIACCNAVIHKCISKLIRTRLKEVVNHVIAEYQVAFVHRRSMVHNTQI